MSGMFHHSECYQSKQSFQPLMLLLKKTRNTLFNGFGFYSSEIKSCTEEQIKYIKLETSQINSFLNQIFNGYIQDTSSIPEFMDINERLSEQNKILFQKLKEAESHIHTLQSQGRGLKQCSERRNLESCERCLFKDNQISNLQKKLTAIEEEIDQNLEELVSQLQEKKQYVWKVEGQLQEMKKEEKIQSKRLKQSCMLIENLRNENIKLQMTIRNMKKSQNKSQKTSVKHLSRNMTETSETFEMNPRTKRKSVVSRMYLGDL